MVCYMERDYIERVKQELQAVTGIMTEDIDYLVYLVLKDGQYFKPIDVKYDKALKNEAVKQVADFEEWFKKL